MADFNDYFIKPRKLDKLIKKLDPTLGTAIFIDMVGSTVLKSEEMKMWTEKMRNTFLLALKSFKPIKDSVVKLIGDEMFIFLPDKFGQINHLQILDQVKIIISNFNSGLDFDQSLIGLKGAIHYCDDVYNITIFDRQNDYHGLGIELTEGLMIKSSRDILIISDRYFEICKKNNFDIKKNIEGPYAFKPKGINRLVKFYKLDCNKP